MIALKNHKKQKKKRSIKECSRFNLILQETKLQKGTSNVYRAITLRFYQKDFIKKDSRTT